MPRRHEPGDSTVHSGTRLARQAARLAQDLRRGIADSAGAAVPPYDACVRPLRTPPSHHGPPRRWDARDNGRLPGTAVANFPTDADNEAPSAARGSPVRSRPVRPTRDGRTPSDSGQPRDAAHSTWTSRARTQHGGFRLHRWTHAAPDDLLQGFARARNAIADTPTGGSSNRTPPGPRSEYGAQRLGGIARQTCESSFKTLAAAAPTTPGSRTEGAWGGSAAARRLGPVPAHRHEVPVERFGVL